MGETSASGTIAWRYGLENEQLLALRYGKGVVLAGTSAGITGIDAETGKKLWQTPIVGPGAMGFTDDGIVYACGTEPDGERVIALDVVSGQRKWSFDAPGDTTLVGVHGSRDGIVYLIISSRSGHREIAAVDASARTVRWTVACPTENTSLYIPPAGSLIYSSRDNGSDLLALDIENNGATAWSRQDDSAIHSTTIGTGFVSGVILAADGSRTISGLDPKTGALLWKTAELATPADAVFSAADTYYRCDGTKLQALRPGAEATVLWTLTVSDKAEAHNAAGYLDSGACYFLAANTLRAIDARTGNPRWSRIVDDPSPDLPFTVGESHAYLASSASEVTAVVR